MGHSETIHCIGNGREWKNEDGTVSRHIYYAMNLLEVKQARIKAMRDGDQIEWWYAQTKTGMRILGIPDENWEIKDEFVKDIKTVTCPKCGGRQGCQICNWSGVTTRKHLSGFRAWQLEPVNVTI